MGEFLSAGGSGFLAGLITGLLFISWIIAADTNADWRAEAIERGYGQYCASNGVWAWKGECPTASDTEGET